MNDFIPLIQGWLSAGSLTGLFALALRHWLAVRKLGMEGKEADRLGYRQLIEALEADVKAVREEHARCEVGMTAMRNEMAALHRLLVTLSLQHGFPLDGFPSIAARTTG